MSGRAGSCDEHRAASLAHLLRAQNSSIPRQLKVSGALTTPSNAASKSFRL
jgi:hypothetical protein